MKKVIRKILGRTKADPISNQYKKSYSQDGEDMLLSSIFDDLGGREKGFFIDIGALHPFRFSNTAFFYEKGWNGINIEPTPNAISLFEKYRSRDINLNIGIGEQHDTLTFCCFDEPALNSFSKELSEERHNNTVYNIKERIQIPIYPLAEVLDKHLPKGQKIDFMSIDVEGLDMQVLNSNNWERYVPDFLFVEEIMYLADFSDSKIDAFLKTKSYKMVAKTTRTLLYRHQSTF